MNEMLKEHKCRDARSCLVLDAQVRVLLGGNVALLSVTDDDDTNEYTAVIGIRYCPFCGEKLA